MLARHALVPGLGAHLSHALRGENEARSFALQPAAEDFFCPAGRGSVATQRIDVCRIQKIDTAFGRGIENGIALLFMALKSKRHRSQAEPGNAQAGPAEFRVVHSHSLTPRSRKAEAFRGSCRSA